MEPTLDDQIKVAQRDKYLAEIEKTKAEKVKLELECDNLKDEREKPWWQKYFSALLGLGFLGFFITFVIYPMSTIENKELRLQTKIDAEKLHDNEIKFKIDSVNFTYYKDSFTSKLDSEAQLNSKLKESRDDLVKGYELYINNLKETKTKENITSLNKLRKLQEDYDELNKTLNKNKTGVVQFQFYDQNKVRITATFHITIINQGGNVVDQKSGSSTAWGFRLPYDKYAAKINFEGYLKSNIDFEINKEDDLEIAVRLFPAIHRSSDVKSN